MRASAREIAEVAEAEAALTPNGVEVRPEPERARVAQHLAREQAAARRDHERLLARAAARPAGRCSRSACTPVGTRTGRASSALRAAVAGGHAQRFAVRGPVFEPDLELRVQGSEARGQDRAQRRRSVRVLAKHVHRLDHAGARRRVERGEARAGLGLGRAGPAHRGAERLAGRVAGVPFPARQIEVARHDAEAVGEAREQRSVRGAHACGTSTSAASGGSRSRSECAKP